MFLDYPNEYTYGTATRYQYMYGTDFLVAPVYQNTKADKEGNDIRNGIYLPEGTWIDYFSGEKYEGNRILSNFDTPVWKLPVFVKNGAIIPMTQPNNNVSEIDPSLRIYEFYPNRHTATVEDDETGDGSLPSGEIGIYPDRIERRRKEPCDYHHSSHSRKFRRLCKR